jgi:hypothetical protein
VLGSPQRSTLLEFWMGLHWIHSSSQEELTSWQYWVFLSMIMNISPFISLLISSISVYFFTFFFNRRGFYLSWWWVSLSCLHMYILYFDPFTPKYHFLSSSLFHWSPFLHSCPIIIIIIAIHIDLVHIFLDLYVFHYQGCWCKWN